MKFYDQNDGALFEKTKFSTPTTPTAQLIIDTAYNTLYSLSTVLYYSYPTVILLKSDNAFYPIKTAYTRVHHFFHIPVPVSDTKSNHLCPTVAFRSRCVLLVRYRFNFQIFKRFISNALNSEIKTVDKIHVSYPN